MTKMVDVECIVLQIQEYKENDALVSVCTKESIFTVFARGIQKQTSKNRKICQPFSKVMMTLSYTSEKAMPMLIHGNVLEYYYHIQEDLMAQSVCFVLHEMIKKSKINERIYDALDACYKSYQIGVSNPLTYATLVLKEILVEEGIGMHVHGCVSCQRKDKLETISLHDGGFLCHYCNNGRFPVFAKEELIQYYSLFALKDKDKQRFLETMDYNIDQFIYLSKWYEEHAHASLVSLQFLNAIKSL